MNTLKTLLLGATLLLAAQAQSEADKAATDGGALYQQHCALCHGGTVSKPRHSACCKSCRPARCTAR